MRAIPLACGLVLLATAGGSCRSSPPPEPAAQQQDLTATQRLERIAVAGGSAAAPAETPDRGLDLRGQRLTGQDFQGAEIPFSRLEEADLSDSNFSRANLAKVDLSRAVLARADLSSSNLSRSILHQSVLEGANLQGTNLVGADLRGARLHGATLKNTYLTAADLRQTEGLGPEQLVLSRWATGDPPLFDPGLEKALVAMGKISDIRPPANGLRGPDLAGANLKSLDLGNANLRGSDLSEAVLRGADLREADLEGANLREADLSGANLRRARGLRPDQLQQARWDADWPPRVDDALAVALQPAETRAGAPAAIDLLFAESFVIDGIITPAMKVDPGCRKDCRTSLIALDRVFGLSGLHAGSMTVSGGSDIAAVYQRMKSLPGGQLVETFNDLEKARREGKYGILLYIQQVPLLDGDATAARRWFDHGIRIVQPAYSSDLPAPHLRERNKLAGGADEPDQGLTELGRRVIQELQALGVIIDVSHCSEKTAMDIIQMSRVPVLANHANPQALTLTVRGPDLLGRNKTDRELLAIADTGGVIGATTVSWMLDRDGDAQAGISDFLAHVDYLVRLVGEDHVGLGSDSALDGWAPDDIHYADAVLAAPDRWKVVAEGLRREYGYSDRRLQKILGLNFRRVYEQVLPGLGKAQPQEPPNRVTLEASHVKLKWRAPRARGVAAPRFEVVLEKKVGGEFLAAGAPTSTTDTEAVFEQLDPGAQYRWFVKAVAGSLETSSEFAFFRTAQRTAAERDPS